MDNEEVESMLEEASQLVHRDPVSARELAERAAVVTHEPEQLARADYVRAQVYALSGEFDRALELVERARQGFDRAGSSFAAVRTQLGRIHVLNEQGHHEDAIAVGEQLLTGLEDAEAGRGAGLPGVTRQQRSWLFATVHRNLAPCYALTGRHERALESGRAAERGYLASDDGLDAAAVRHWIGEQLLDLGRVHEALETLIDARDAFGRAGHTLSEARCLVDLGRASVLVGRWADGLGHLARARDLLERLDVRPEIDQLLLCAAETWLALGLHEEALVAYQEAEDSLRQSGQPHYLARVLLGAGAALARAGRLSDARAALDEAAELYRSAGNLPLLAQVLLETADVQSRSGDREAARAFAGQAVLLLTDADWGSQAVYAHLRVADLALPDLVRAEGHLLTASRLCVGLALPPLQYRVDARLGHVRRLAGRPVEAKKCLQSSIAVVEQLRAGLPSDAMRTSFLRDAAAPYAELVALELAAGDDVAAFDAAERSKSRALTDLLAGRDARVGTKTARRDAALRAELAAGYTHLLGADDSDATTAVRVERRAAVARHVAQVVAAMQEEQLRAAGDVAPADAPPVGAPRTVERIVSALPRDLAVLAYHVLDDDVVAFVLEDGDVRGVSAVTSLARVRPLLRQLDAQWQRFGAGGELALRHRERLTATTRRVLQQLHDELLAPLGALPATPRLAVVAHGPLHEVPFHALHDGQQWLLERYEISLAPSASVLAETLGRVPATGPALVLGVADEAAVHVTDEATAVAAALPGSRLHLSDAATAEVLRRDAPGSSVVHIACHGLFRPESPDYSALRLGDAWLTAVELLEVDLDGALVVLTACETGRSRARGPGDEVVGLTRAALGAGASAVLVSLWLVQDDVAARLVTRWYALMATGLGAAAALRRVQLDLAQAGEHPYRWAPFVLVGAPGTRAPVSVVLPVPAPLPEPQSTP